MENQRDWYFDNLKGFLILTVIIGNSLELVNPQSVDIHYFILFLYMFHMPLFTFVSGYFCMKSKRSTKHKVIHTFKLYCFAQLFYIILNKYFLGSYDLKPELLAPQWTLWYLLSLTCWYILSDYIEDKKKWLFYSIIVSLILGFDGSIGTISSTSRTVFFLPFFIGGMMFKKEQLEFLKKHIFKFGISTIIVLVVLKLISHDTPVELLFEYARYNWFFDSSTFPFFVRVFHYIGAFFIGAVILCANTNKKTPLSILGKYSLLLYLTHSGVSKIYVNLNILKYSNLVNLIISEAIIVLTTIAISISYVKLKELYLKKKVH
ncbi:MAG: acyltransferase family protein [Clostridium sp.]